MDELHKEIWRLASGTRDRPEAVAALVLRYGEFKNNASVAIGGEFYNFRNLQAANIVYLRQKLVRLSDDICNAFEPGGPTLEMLDGVRETPASILYVEISIGSLLS